MLGADMGAIANMALPSRFILMPRGCPYCCFVQELGVDLI
jgi:hypothetical protein